jgi:hypothetical protein
MLSVHLRGHRYRVLPHADSVQVPRSTTVYPDRLHCRRPLDVSADVCAQHRVVHRRPTDPRDGSRHRPPKPQTPRFSLTLDFTVWYAIGSFIVYWIVYGISKSSTNLGDWQYRIPILCQIVVPSIITAGMFWCPESPRWLVETGRVERARESLSRTRIPSDVEEELGAIVAAVNFEKAVVDSSHKWWTPCKCCQHMCIVRPNSRPRSYATEGTFSPPSFPCRALHQRWPAGELPCSFSSLTRRSQEAPCCRAIRLLCTRASLATPIPSSSSTPSTPLLP